VTERTVAIKVTSDGQAFVVDMAANAKATQALSQSVADTGRAAQAAAAQIHQSSREAATGLEQVAAGIGQAKQGAMTWTEFVKANMGPAMRQFSAEGLSHADAHTKAIRQIAEQWKAYKASGVEANAGVLSAAKAVAPQLAEAARGVDRLGASAASSGRMMRMVGPQFTDMVTQIAAGQSPLQILIQQGGQLKDVFGGVGPAARALGAYVGAMITPVSVAAVVVGALAYAAFSGAEEVAKFERQVTLSGNAAGGTVSQYRQMAAELAKIGGTKSAALDAIGQFAQTGRVGAEHLQRFAGIAQQLDRLVGKPVADTAKEFAALAESPVDASVKLTQTYNHLTAATLRQIKALKDAGEHTQAVELAQTSLADALQQRMPEMSRNLGGLERLWRGIKSAVSGVADALLDIGRPLSAQQQSDQAAATVTRLQAQIDSRKARGLATGDLDQRLAAVKALVPATQALVAEEAKAAFAAAEQAKQTEAEKRFSDALNQSLSVREQRKNRIAQIEADGALARRPQAEIDAAVAAAREKMVDPKEQDALGARLARLQKFNDQQAEIIRSGVEQVAAAYRQGLSSEVEFIERTAALEVQQLERDRQLVQSKIAIARQKANSQREVAELEGEAVVLEEKIAGRRQKAISDVETTQAQRAKKAREAVAAEVAQWKDEWAQAEKAAADRYNAATQMVQQYVDAIALEGKAVDFEIGLMGRSADEQRKLIELRKIDIALLKEKEKISNAAKGGNLTAAQQQELVDKAERGAAEARAQVATRIWIDRWSSTNREVGETLYDVLTGRTRDAASKAQAIFENLVLKPTILAAVQPISGAVASALTGASSAGAGGANGILGSATGSALGSVFGAGGIGGSLAAGAGWLTGATSLSGSLGAAGSLLTSGTTAGALSGAGMALGALGPIALGAAAIYSLFGKKGGGPKVDGSFGLLNSGIGAGNHTTESDSAARTAAQAIQAQYSGILQAFGRQGDLSFGLGYSADPKGDSPTFLDVTASRGGAVQFTDLNRDVGRSQEELTAAIGAMSTEAILRGLRQANLTGKVGEILQQLGDVGQRSADELTQALAQVNEEAARATAARQQRAQLEERLFQLTASQTEKLARTREQERAAVDESNRALLDQIYAQEDLAAAAEKAAERLDGIRSKLSNVVADYLNAEQLRAFRAREIQQRLSQAGMDFSPEQILGATREDLRQLYLRMEALGNTGAQEAILDVARAFAELHPEAEKAAAAIQSTRDGWISATDAAYAALERATAAERERAELAASVAQEELGALRSIFDMLRSEIGSLYGEAAAQMAAAAGRQFIDQALSTALATGYLPDQADLAGAIGAARGGMGAANYASAFEQKRDQLVLAGQLSQLQGVAGKAIPVAERQLQAAKEQIKQLDETLQFARQQIDALRGIDTSVISVRDAIDRLALALAREAATAGKKVAATEQWVDSPMGKVWQSTGGAIGLQNAAGLTISGITGDQYTADTARAWVNAQAAAGDRASIYAKAIEQGISANSLDALMRLPAGYSNREAAAMGLPSFDVGTDFVPGDMNARIHRGERIVPADVNRRDGLDFQRMAQVLEQQTAEARAQARAQVTINQRMVKLLERWEFDGMPQTRTV